VTPARTQPTHASEQGFALIEVLVSALCIAIVGGAVATTLQATARSASDSRNHTMAQAIAIEDQARLRSTRISSLNKLSQTPQIYPVTLDGTTFTVTSTGVFVNNTSQTASCASGQTSADYIRISSSVTWTALGKRPPVMVESIVSPSNGSLDPGHGTLTFSTINAAGKPLPGVGISGTGSGTFSGTTDASGCATFADLPAGNYTVTASAPGLVDKFGKAPTTLNPSPGVNPSSTNTAQLQYDIPGTIEASFKYRVGSTTEFKTSSQRSIAVYNSGTGAPTPTFVSGGSSPVPSIKLGSLFPFTSKYAVYAGSCTENNPNPTSNPEAPGAGAVAGFEVTPGATVQGAIHLPALNLVVKDGATLLSGAKVKITGTCSFSREYTTTTGGVLPDGGLPWGTYTICAQKGSGSSTRRKTVSNQAVQNLTTGTSVTIDLSSGTTSSAC
jgi:Tfp pilus assembly protein PilV